MNLTVRTNRGVQIIKRAILLSQQTTQKYLWEAHYILNHELFRAFLAMFPHCGIDLFGIKSFVRRLNGSNIRVTSECHLCHFHLSAPPTMERRFPSLTLVSEFHGKHVLQKSLLFGRLQNGECQLKPNLGHEICKNVNPSGSAKSKNTTKTEKTFRESLPLPKWWNWYLNTIIHDLSMRFTMSKCSVSGKKEIPTWVSDTGRYVNF